MHDVIIVGGGIFGCVIGKTLRHAGLNVKIIDDNRPGSGSKPAACLMKPGWFSGFSKEEVDESMELLDLLYDVQTINFKTEAANLKVGSVDVFWVDPKKILSEEKTYAEVVAVKEHKEYCTVEIRYPNLDKREVLSAHKVIVAAGIWTQALCPDVKVEPKTGVVFKSPGHVDPVIKVWAPYKQLVAFNIEPDRVWVGDGSALKPSSMTEERVQQSLDRCSPYLNKDMFGQVEQIVGHRPYVAGAKPAYCRKESEHVWCATGGAKNGTIAAAWCAIKISEALT